MLRSRLQREPIVDLIALWTLFRWWNVVKEPDIEYPICVHMNRTIESFSEEQCDRLFRFRKEDLRRLHQVLQMPETVRTDNRCCFTSEEVLLLSLCRMATPANRMEDLSLIFGRDYSQWSRAFRWFLQYMKETFGNRIMDNLAYWEPMFAECAEAIRRKAAEKCGCHFGPGFKVCGFIDDNCFETCAPGGPLHSGRGSERASNLLQRAFYNGWKAKHGLKWQTFDLPNGLTCDLYGPRTIRLNDLRVLNRSRLMERLAEVQDGNEVQYVAYGDGIFPLRDHLRSRHRQQGGGPPLSERQILENETMAVLRIAIEWHYGELCKLFPFLDYKSNLKIRLQPLSDLYFTATFLRNCHTCLYENNTSRYFDCKPPTLENFVLNA